MVVVSFENLVEIRAFPNIFSFHTRQPKISPNLTVFSQFQFPKSFKTTYAHHSQVYKTYIRMWKKKKHMFHVHLLTKEGVNYKISTP